jgi:hypothetical protein
MDRSSAPGVLASRDERRMIKAIAGIAPARARVHRPEIDDRLGTIRLPAPPGFHPSFLTSM